MGQGEGPFLGVFAGERQGFAQPVGGFAGPVEGELGAGFEVVKLPFVGEEVYGFFGFGGEGSVVAEALEDIEVVEPYAVDTGFEAYGFGVFFAGFFELVGAVEQVGQSGMGGGFLGILVEELSGQGGGFFHELRVFAAEGLLDEGDEGFHFVVIAEVLAFEEGAEGLDGIVLACGGGTLYLAEGCCCRCIIWRKPEDFFVNTGGFVSFVHFAVEVGQQVVCGDVVWMLSEECAEGFFCFFELLAVYEQQVFAFEQLVGEADAVLELVEGFKGLVVLAAAGEVVGFLVVVVGVVGLEAQQLSGLPGCGGIVFAGI